MIEQKIVYFGERIEKEKHALSNEIDEFEAFYNKLKDFKRLKDINKYQIL